MKLPKLFPPPEALLWLAALVALACYVPSADTHITVCPLANAGFEFCPGCGLGRSIAYWFHGNWQQGWQAHPLGIFAIIILSYRIITLTRTHYKSYG